MIKDKRIAIIGLGLIGGSIARGLKVRLGVKEIIGISDNDESIEDAINDGIISWGSKKIDERFLDIDMVFICTPIKISIKYLEILNGKVKPNCIVTDVCSTKLEIINKVNDSDFSFNFIGGHPMTGSEKSGYKASKEHLFENAYYILTKARNTNEESYNILINIVEGMGAMPIDLEPNEHDLIMGCISHFPHIVAAGLVNIVKDDKDCSDKMKLLAAGGFRDITRIASSNSTMWEHIVLSNKGTISEIIEKFIKILKDFEESMSNRTSKDIVHYFERAKNFRESMYNQKKRIKEGAFEIYVDVVDSPGTIGEIATILGKYKINIKNINVLNSREFENGCLLIALRDFESMKKAEEVLNNNGIKAYKDN